MILFGILDPFSMLWSGVYARIAGSKRSAMKQIELPRLGAVEIALSIDFVGDNCLRTNLLTKKALDRAKRGEVIEIISDNLSSVETIPFMLANYDCVHMATMQDDQCWKIYVRKREPSK